MKFLNNTFSKKKASSKQKGNNNINIQNSDIHLDPNYINVLNFARKGQIDEVINQFDILKRSVENQHPCAPYWKYDISINNNEGIKIGHIPTSKEAFEKYPLKGDIKFKLPDEYKWAKNINQLVRYGYEKQIPITLDLEELKIWIGDYLIESMKSDNENKCTLKLLNKEFPPPIPVKIEFGDNIFSIDYLEIGITEINGSKVTLSNEKEELAKILIKFIIDLENHDECKFRIDINKGYESNVEANLLVSEFLIRCKQNLTINIILLKEGKRIMSFNKPNIEDAYISLEKRNDILRELRKLEKHYYVEFTLPKYDITQEDLENITILLCSIDNKPYNMKYDSIDLTLEVNKDSNQYEIIKNSESSILTAEYNDKSIKLFNQVINFKEAYVEFYNAIVENKDHVLKKFEVLDDGDIIKIKFIPKGNNTCKIFYK